MRHAATRLLMAVVAALALTPASAGVIFQDLPTANSNFESHHIVGGPVLADDFTSDKTADITLVEWWGSRALNQGWEVTLHVNRDATPAAPDAFPVLNGGFKLFVTAIGEDTDGDGIFRYSAAINDPNWSLISGNSYWFSAANIASGWTWAITDGVAEIGSEFFSAVGSVGSAQCPDGGPHCGAWNPIGSDLAFRIHAVPEPGTLTLLGLSLGALALARRRRM